MQISGDGKKVVVNTNILLRLKIQAIQLGTSGSQTVILATQEADIRRIMV
jgi:hypothetical protein